MMYHKITISDAVVLSQIQANDANSIARHIHDPDIYKNTLRIPYPYTVENANHFITAVQKFEKENQKQKDWAIRMYGEMVGGIGLLFNFGPDSHRSEIGYWLTKSYRGRGIMGKVIKKFSDFCFTNYGMTRLEAHVFAQNEASKKVLINNGYQLEGLIKAAFIKDNKFVDAFLYAKISPDLKQ